MRRFAQCVEYVGKFDENYKTDLENIINGRLATIYEQYSKRIKKDGEDRAKLWYIRQDPLRACFAKGGSSVEKLAKLYNQERSLEVKIQMEKEIPAFQSPEQFNFTPDRQKWVKNEYQPSLALVGEEGTGKTSFAHMMAQVINQVCKGKKGKTLVINHIEGATIPRMLL
jgi:polynucleotide 5'-kinase involved in rRNA processing